MDKETNSNKSNSNLVFEKELDELGSSIINIKINKNRHHKKVNNQENNNKKENEKNNENKIEKKENEQNLKHKESFNLEDFDNFIKQNANVQIASNNNNQLKSHHKPHLKLKLNLGSKKKVPPIEIKKENDEQPENIIKDEDIKDNININDINNKKNQINNQINEEGIQSPSQIQNNNKEESSFFLKQKFDNINESQISYEANNSFQNMNLNFQEHKKVKKKFKLSLYQLQKLALLGVGASGEVYLVQDTKTKKKLALKSVKYTEDEKTKSQLETEVKLGTLLKHENIIRIYATYFLKGRINFVMEYMDKGTLLDILKKVKKIPEKYMGIITYQVVKGLAYCQKEKKLSIGI